MERLYLDTSVFGGYFEPEFEYWTRILFERIKKGYYKLLLSELTNIELAKAPQNVQRVVLSLPGPPVENIEITNKAIELADTYINENVVSERSRGDCLHIALATM